MPLKLSKQLFKEKYQELKAEKAANKDDGQQPFARPINTHTDLLFCPECETRNLQVSDNNCVCRHCGYCKSEPQDIREFIENAVLFICPDCNYEFFGKKTDLPGNKIECVFCGRIFIEKSVPR
ncbi:hypothetical protein TRIP_B350095 [uncultured Desulfatiglans sp.]|nr:hypothetical protein TRIP_B350095 [uncultured Desulfatiglans sp.]